MEEERQAGEEAEGEMGTEAAAFISPSEHTRL